MKKTSVLFPSFLLLLRFIIYFVFTASCRIESGFLHDIISVASYAIPCLLYALFFRDKHTQVLSGQISIFSVYFSALFLACATKLLTAVIYNGQNNNESIIAGFDAWGILWRFLYLCIMIPIFEEFMFRKIFSSAFQSFGAIIAITVPSAVFALCHTPDSILYSFIMGCALGYIAASKGIVYSMCFHAFNNVLNFGLNLSSMYLSQKFFGIIAVLLFIAITVLGCFGFISLVRGVYGKKS